MTRLIALALLAGLAACESTPKSPSADRVFVGTVVTMDPAQPTAEAVAIKDGRIVAVGTERDLKPYLGQDTWVTQLEDAVLLPGFIDLHNRVLGEVPAEAAARSVEDIVLAMQAAAREGITTTTEESLTLGELDLIDQANRRGALLIDVVALPTAPDAPRLIGRRDFDRYRGRLRLAGIRFDLDEGADDRWKLLVRHCAANNVRVLAACYDAVALDRLLDVMEDLPEDRRLDSPVIIHAFELNDAQVDRCAALGAMPSSPRREDLTLPAITVDAAARLDESDEKGTITVGKRADIVLLNTNPVGLEDDALREVEVWQTYKDGQLIWEQEDRPLRVFRRWTEPDR